MLQIEKEHKRSTLMTAKKKDLVDQVMRLEHNNNVLEDTINQQAINFRALNETLIEKAANELSQTMGRKTQFEQGFHAALDELKQFGKGFEQN